MDTSTALPAQHEVALKEANRIRVARARLKADLAAKPNAPAARNAAARLLENPGHDLATMTVFELLCACRGQGPHKARRLLFTRQIPERKHVGELTSRQAHDLAGALRRPKRGG